MTASEALIVGEGWISEHYFTTDATSQLFTAKVSERRKLWHAESAEHRPTAADPVPMVLSVSWPSMMTDGCSPTFGVLPFSTALGGARWPQR